MTKRSNFNAQGEITFCTYEGELPSGLIPFAELDKMGRPIISHSETGSHHLLDAVGVTVLEKPDAPEGMRILYAFLDKPTDLIQDAPDAHGAHKGLTGLIEFRVAREYDPFLEQARRVAD